MLLIGSHVSFKSDSQLLGSVKEALSYGANSLMLYTGAPQNTQRGKINDLITIEALQLMKENGLTNDHIICHAPYIINLANNIDIEKYQFSIDFFRGEIERCQQLGIRYIVLHPGSATKLDKDEAIQNIIYAINKALVKEDDIVILLETMAGKGTEIGVDLSELKTIIDGITYQEKIGVCLDTCHLNDAGIDISKFNEYLDEFDKVIGINKIGCVHVNDSKNPLGSHKDRHENIGFGTIGFDSLISVLYNPRLDRVPKILETPYVDKEFPPYKEEINMIRSREFNANLYVDVVNHYKK